MLVDILTIFPEMLAGVLGYGIPRIAQEKKLAEVRLHNIRDYSTDKHGKTDDAPYGGGPGMIMTCAPVFDAVGAVMQGERAKSRLIMLTPGGRPFTQAVARELADESGLILLCGRYEGFDDRIREGLAPDEISVGDYVLSGGEIAAMVIVDAVIRLLPGVLGCEASAQDESFENDLLEYPQYTRPPVFRGMEVPEILLSGDHGKIAQWRCEQALKRTKQRRSDLLRRRGTTNDGPDGPVGE